MDEDDLQLDVVDHIEHRPRHVCNESNGVLVLGFPLVVIAVSLNFECRSHHRSLLALFSRPWSMFVTTVSTHCPERRKAIEEESNRVMGNDEKQ